MAHQHTTRNQLIRWWITGGGILSWVSLISVGVMASLSLLLLVLELFSQ